MEKIKKPELIVIANDDFNFGGKEQSLQGGFKNFRSYINAQRKKNAIKQKEDKENPENMLKLRYKFLDTAKSLIGIPYGKKYLEKHPEYDGDLFLDCCGLVRHAVNLLKDDFGFSLCRWNQAYQYDILPDEISFEEMQPGDLIFYSGIFYPDKNMKSQIHNMTHVEIYLGEGEKTIGSRESDGTVEIFDTFQFMSEKYFNIKYHFKSIDTWLKGIHKSFCPEHKWHEGDSRLLDRDKLNRFSAFYEEYQQEEEADGF